MDSTQEVIISYKRYVISINLSHQVALIASAALAIGNTTSPAITSIATALLLLSCFLNIKNFKHQWKEIFKPYILGIILLYFLHFIDFKSAYNITDFLNELKIKLPYLLIPLSFLFFKPTSQDFRIISFFFLMTLFIVSLFTLINYFQNYDEMNERILHSKEIPIVTKITHIYFSTMLAFGVFLAFYLYTTMNSRFYLWIGVFLAFCLHLFSSRTGLVAFYISALGTAFFYIIKHKAYKIGSFIVMSFIVFPFIAYWTMPSIKNRIQNTLEDIQLYRNGGDINHRSISMRLVAWEMAWKSFQEEPLWGCGTADIGQTLHKQYAKNHVPLKPELWLKDLHNQFLEFLVGLGLLGCLVFLWWFFSPLFASQLPLLLLQFWLIIFSAMFAESILERQFGIAFCLFWFYFLQNYFQAQISENQHS